GVSAGVGVVEKGVVSRVKVIPDDLPRVVDALCPGAAGAQGIVDGGVVAPPFHEGVNLALGVAVNSDDLASVADAIRSSRAAGSGRIVERDVQTQIGDVDEAVVAAATDVSPGDLAQVVNAEDRRAD